ncbi:MAG TPA: ATP-binding protein [Lachnospiraceae bacterium]|nr:ATP-binding protein [Lachnospiraceae bacterium]
MSDEKEKIPMPKANFKVDANPGSHVEKMIGVVSGKGGVGKSSVTGLCATWARSQGYKTAIMDCDITGPSIPRMFGVSSKDVGSDEKQLFPAETATGIKIMSMNLLMTDETQPVIWRGPVIAGVVKQFWTDVCWGDVDYMFVDMPPGTGDVPLTVFQSLPVDGILVVTTPQDLVSMIVTKALRMAQSMDIPVLGIIENMSYAVCPHCGEKIRIFGESHLDEIAKENSIPVVAQLPIDPKLASMMDEGTTEYFDDLHLDALKDVLPKLS